MPAIVYLENGAARGCGRRRVGGFSAGKNSLGGPYLGPCPARDNAPQHYVYTLITASLEAGAQP